MAQGKILWRRGSSETDDILVFDPGYEYDSGQLHIYQKSESISVADAKDEIVHAEHISEKHRENIEDISRETLSRLLVKARTGREPTLFWDVDTASRD